MAERPAARPFFALFLRYWLPLLVYLTVIFTLSAQPNLQPPVQFTYSDKVCHILEYGGLGVLLMRAIRATARVRLLWVAALMALSLGVIVGVSDEFFQSFVPGRDSSVFDVLADATGLLLAQIAYLLVVRE